MRHGAQEDYQRAQQFFHLILSHESLFNHYKINFLLMYNHKFTLTELEEMLPWERDVYISLLEQHLEDLKKAKENE